MILAIYLAYLDNDEEVKRFEEIYEQNYNNMLWKAKTVLGDEASAEDVVQEAFIRILKSKNKYFAKTNKELAGLCVLMAKHMALNVLRDTKREVCAGLTDEEKDFVIHKRDEGLSADILNNLIQKEEAKKIHDLVDQLPEKYSTVLTLFYGFEYSCREIADMLELKSHTVEMQLSRGRAMIGELLREQGYGAD